MSRSGGTLRAYSPAADVAGVAGRPKDRPESPLSAQRVVHFADKEANPTVDVETRSRSSMSPTRWTWTNRAPARGLRAGHCLQEFLQALKNGPHGKDPW
jgi:hypothetical protein